MVEGRVDVEGDAHGCRGVGGRRPPDYAGATMTTASPPRRRPVDLDAYGPQGRSPWLDVDWRAHQRWVEVGGQAVNVIDLGAGPAACVFVHGLSGSWQNWLENLPGSGRRPPRASRWTCPGFGQSPMPRREDLDPRLRPPRRRAARRLGVDARRASWATRWAASSAAEVAIQFPARVERLVLVSAAGLSIEYQRNEHVLARPAARRAAPDRSAAAGSRRARTRSSGAAHAARAAGDRRGPPRAAPGPAERRAAARLAARRASSTRSTR